MNRVLVLLIALLVSTAALVAVARPREDSTSDFCKSLTAGNRILLSADWYNWGCAPIYGPDGKVHVFVCRWPAKTRMAGWTKAAEIAHAVADRPEGPYKVLGIALKGGGKQAWDTSVYNPNVHQIDGRYVLAFSGQTTRVQRSGKSGRIQQIGLAFADSLEGPWTKSEKNPILRISGKPGSWNATHASNPALVRHPDGRFLIYYKGISDAKPALRTIGVAVADKIEGPYRDHKDNPLISYIDRGGDVEDPHAFYYKDRFYLIMEDRMGVAMGDAAPPKPGAPHSAGGVRPGLIYESKDGFTWSPPKLGYMTNDTYFDEPRERFERPQILWKDGKPECLFLALKGGKHKTSSGAVLRIGDWRK